MRKQAHTAAPLWLAVLASALISGCAGSSADYPPFDIPTTNGEAGRVSMLFPGVEAPEPLDPTAVADPLPAELDARIAAITTRAAKAASAFAAKAQPVSALARSARGADVASERWANAQISFGDLSVHHSEGQLALADLDILAAKLRANMAKPAKLSEIVDIQTRLAAELSQQTETLAVIAAQLDR